MSLKKKKKKKKIIYLNGQFGDVVRELLLSHSSAAHTAGWCTVAELGPTSAESDCSLWSRSSESQTPVAALHRWQQNYKYSEIRTIYTFPPILL